MGLPVATWVPRLLKRPDAARYVSASPTLFDQMVADGRMPKARQISVGRVAWDTRELDAAVDELPPVKDAPKVDTTWEDDDAPQEAAHVR